MISKGTAHATDEIRSRFIRYFSAKEHANISSSPVIPHNDPTLLFTNAGMNQFKDLFLGASQRDYSRAVTSQKCIRAGGKHNDLENVGHTSRHLTFFEMLGNFSFGDYFKKDAIQFAWEVSTEIFQFPSDKIFPTVFTTDDEAFELWTKYVPASRITRLGEKDNFWSMGDTGPCGPCSELYFDRGSKYGEASSPLYDTTGERYLEFWNLVFMQYDQGVQGRVDLPRPSIDTGAGLERVISLMMGVDTLFETDILRELIFSVEKLSKKTYEPGSALVPAFRVIADHIRSITFSIADGAQPSNTDRGYVIRKILRRAVRYGRMLGFERPFLCEIVPTLVSLMGGHYPELQVASSKAIEIIADEEESFFKTLKRGGTLLSDVLVQAQKNDLKVLSGDDTFKLKDTYGLPLEEIMLIAHDSSLNIDMARYKELEEEARVRSKSAHKSLKSMASTELYESILVREGAGEFSYTRESYCSSTVIALIQNGVEVPFITEGESGEILLNTTPFYAEMGGQVGDTGAITTEKMEAIVTATISPYKGIFSHSVLIKDGRIHKGDAVLCRLDEVRRDAIEKHHTATHLLHWALCEVLGSHIRQSGSLVDSHHLRFDFAHHKPLTVDELDAIERRVNIEIQKNHTVHISEMTYDEVQKKSEIKQFFGDKYGSTVRMVEAGPSKELCGGTHVAFTGKIGLFRIVREGSIAAGVRRLEAVSGMQALNYTYEREKSVQEVADMLKVPPQKIIDRLSNLLQERTALEKQIQEIEKAKLHESLKNVTHRYFQKYPSLPLVHGILKCSSVDLKEASDRISEQYQGKACILLGCIEGEKAHLLVKLPYHNVPVELHAVDILKKGLSVLDGKGGGKKEMAQGAGKETRKLADAILFAITSIEL